MPEHDLNKLFTNATKLFFGIPRSSEEPPSVGIAFANSEYPGEAYSGIHKEFSNSKFVVDIIGQGIVLKLRVLEELSSQCVFEAILNYDPIELREFIIKCPEGNSGAFVIGIFHNCQFVIISPAGTGNYKPFQVSAFSIKDEAK